MYKGKVNNLTGWRPIEEGHAKSIIDLKRSVIVYPHSTCMDHVVVGAYCLFDDEMSKLRDKIHLVVRHHSSFIRRMIVNCLPVNTIEIKNADSRNGGNLQRIIEELEKKDEWILIISPSGDITQKDWRRGWHAVAEYFNAPVIVASPDYEKHEMVIRSDRPIYVKNRSYEDVEKEAKEIFNDIVPLNLDMEVGVKTRNHTERSIIARNIIYALLTIIILLIIVYIIAKYWYYPSSNKIDIIMKKNKPKRSNRSTSPASSSFNYF